MSKPNSFCFISTFNCHNELVGMLLSLSIHHNNVTVYGFVDSKTLDLLNNLIPKIQLNLILRNTLDKYSNKNRQQMVSEKLWDEFQMQKANVIDFALLSSSDTLFLDSDILFLAPITNIDKTKEIGLSPHYVKKTNTDEVGYYNGGCLWTKNKDVPNDWRYYTKFSRYHDQASLEDLAKKYSHQEFGEEINFMPWRVLIGVNPQQVVNNINIKDNKLNYKNKEIVFLHTHFNDQRFVQVNNIFINALTKLKRYKELMIIDRIINDKWIIKIPKQPRMGIWNHKNDSFRELAMLYKKNNSDVNIELIDNGHCWLGKNILLYDRPTHEWFNQDLINSSLILLGNGNINVEGKLLKDNGLNVKPWIFWPRRPFIIEKYLSENNRKTFTERSIESIFIGNIENSIQQQFRNTNKSWENVLHEYHCTIGNQHKFTQQEYIEKLSNAKYGLALRGYGSKCHREVELMALGTVPIVTPEVSITSYLNSPEENVHYIRATTPDEFKKKISTISEKDWEIMSKNCYEWYQNNVHSKNSMNIVLTKILYN